MKKALFVATVYKFLASFEKSDMTILRQLGYEIHIATNMDSEEWLRDDGSLDSMGVIKHQIDFGRSPFSKQSVKAYFQLKKLIKEEKYDLVHFHTPVASAVGRMAATKAHRLGTKIIYTCHGFHFHKGSSAKDWIIYYPIEKFLSKKTDMIITINREDFGVIEKFDVAFKEYIPGVGIDYSHIRSVNVDVDRIRKSLSIPDSSFVVLCIGELSARKNQSVLIEAMHILNDDNVYLLLCGAGTKEKEYRDLVKKYSLEKNVLLLGQLEHESIIKLCHAVDIGAVPSKIEGLGLAGLEIMSSGKPIIGSAVHGIKDYLINGETGIAVDFDKPEEYASAINLLAKNKTLRQRYAEMALEKAKEFDIEKSKNKMIACYKKVLGEKK